MLFNQMIKTVLLMLLPFLFACTGDNEPAAVEAVIETTRVEVVRSQANAGDAMPMKYRLTSDAATGQPVTLVIDFQLDPQQSLELVFNQSDRYQWLEELAAVYIADAEGKVTVEIKIVPEVAGKIYLKFLAATVDGERVRAFSIPVLVKDEYGTVPAGEKIVIDRINLPSSSSSH